MYIIFKFFYRLAFDTHIQLSKPQAMECALNLIVAASLLIGGKLFRQITESTLAAEAKNWRHRNLI
jgi:uncharacterized membrane protein